MGESPVSQLMCFQEPFVFSFSHALHLGFSHVAVERVHWLQISQPRLETRRGAHLSENAAISTLIYWEIQPSALNIFCPRKSLSKLWSVDAYRGASKRPIQIRELGLPFCGWSMRVLELLKNDNSVFNPNGDVRNSVTHTWLPVLFFTPCHWQGFQIRLVKLYSIW